MSKTSLLKRLFWNGGSLFALLWYTLVASHGFFAVPAIIDGFMDSSSHTTLAIHQRALMQTTDTTSSSPLPDHPSHSSAAAYFCPSCDVMPLIVDMNSSFLFHDLVQVKSVQTVPARFPWSLKFFQDSIPDSPIPDPPLKIPIPLSA